MPSVEQETKDELPIAVTAVLVDVDPDSNLMSAEREREHQNQLADKDAQHQALLDKIKQLEASSSAGEGETKEELSSPVRSLLIACFV